MSSQLRLRPSTASINRPVLRSLSPVSPLLHLARGVGGEGSLTVYSKQGMGGQDKEQRKWEETLSSPTTQDTRVGYLPGSEGRYRDESPVDALVARERKKAISPIKEQGWKEEPLFPVAAYEKNLLEAEEEARQARMHLTVKDFSQLSDLKIPSREMEKALAGLLALCAEIDPTVDVSGLSRVLASRTWPTVLRYLRSPGQVVQSLRAIIPSIKKGKITKSALTRATELVSSINEPALRSEKCGHEGLLITRYITSVLNFNKAWESAALISTSPQGKRGHKRQVQSVVPEMSEFGQSLGRNIAGQLRGLALEEYGENEAIGHDAVRFSSTPGLEDLHNSEQAESPSK